MTDDGVLADTSILISFLKSNDKYSSEVLKLLQAKRLITTGLVIAELLQGIKNEKEEQHISLLLQGIPSLELSTESWIRAGRLSCSLRRKGICIALTDIAIATLAIENKVSVFSLDKHFRQIPGVKIYRA